MRVEDLDLKELLEVDPPAERSASPDKSIDLRRCFPGASPQGTRSGWPRYPPGRFHLADFLPAFTISSAWTPILDRCAYNV